MIPRTLSDRKTVLVLGAGFSRAAGFPLVADLFEAPTHTESQRAATRDEAVRGAWRAWHKENVDAYAEQFMDEIYTSWWGTEVEWEQVIEFLGRALATPLGNFRYYISARNAQTIFDGLPHPVYAALWSILLTSCDLIGVVTFNYDLLVERTLRHLEIPGLQRRGIHYGGCYNVPVIGLRADYDLGSNKYRFRRDSMLLHGRLPVCKLHGSLNFAVESDQLVIYADTRAAFRRHDRALIVPPLPGKSINRALKPIWKRAKATLTRADAWVICGYSMPPYDSAAVDLFRGAASDGRVRDIIIADPHAEVLVDRWRSLTDREIRWHPLPGLPAALGSLGDALGEHAS